MEEKTKNIVEDCMELILSVILEIIPPIIFLCAYLVLYNWLFINKDAMNTVYDLKILLLKESFFLISIETGFFCLNIIVVFLYSRVLAEKIKVFLYWPLLLIILLFEITLVGTIMYYHANSLNTGFWSFYISLMTEV